MRRPMRRIARAEMPEGDSLVVTNGQGTTIRIDRGCVWITEEKSFIDHVLVAGQHYTFDRPGVAIATAREDARVTLDAPRIGRWPARVALAGKALYVRPVWQTIVGILLPTPATS
jgi:Protein of unknown function (DUF2917)